MKKFNIKINVVIKIKGIVLHGTQSKQIVKQVDLDKFSKITRTREYLPLVVALVYLFREIVDKFL